MLVLAPELYLPLRQLGAQYHASADGLAVAERLLDLLEAPAAVMRRGTRTPRVGTVRFEGVSFAYPTRGPVLDAFELELRPGESLGYNLHVGDGGRPLAADVVSVAAAALVLPAAGLALGAGLLLAAAAAPLGARGGGEAAARGAQLDPLEQRDGRVGRKLEYPAVEVEPRQITVDQPLRRLRHHRRGRAR